MGTEKKIKKTPAGKGGGTCRGKRKKRSQNVNLLPQASMSSVCLSLSFALINASTVPESLKNVIY
ncbi:MAG: hypothetical protein L3J49_13960 [Desulfobulbaceae bacterium]|nr:hypothetical protein [Desulfobulbaceae bacterium]